MVEGNFVKLRLGLGLGRRLEHAVAGRSYPESHPGAGIDSYVVLVSLLAAPLAPRFAIEKLQRDSAYQRRLERKFPRKWKLLLVELPPLVQISFQIYLTIVSM